MRMASSVLVRKRAQKFWEGLSRPLRIYLVGLLAFGIAMFMVLTRAKGLIINWTFAAAMICLGAGFLRESFDWAALRKDNPLFKQAKVILTVIALAIATASGAITVADATAQDPTTFKTSIAVIAPLAFIPVLAFVVMVLSALGFPVVMLITMGQQAFAKKAGTFSGLLVISRVLGLLALIVGAGQLLNPSTRLDAGLKQIAAYSAYMLDMYPNASCAATPGDRVVRVNDNLVIVGRITEAGPRFRRELCALTAEAAPLPPPKASK